MDNIIGKSVEIIKTFKALQELDALNDFWDNRLGYYDKQMCFKDYCGFYASVSDMSQWYKDNQKYFNKKKLKQILKEYNKKENGCLSI